MVQALILGSLFYMIPQNTNGLFTKAGYVIVLLLYSGSC